MINTLAEFIIRCETATNDEIYELFEFGISDKVRTQVLFFADLSSTEPVRSAMHRIGFTDY